MSKFVYKAKGMFCDEISIDGVAINDCTKVKLITEAGHPPMVELTLICKDGIELYIDDTTIEKHYRDYGAYKLVPVKHEIDIPHSKTLK